MHEILANAHTQVSSVPLSLTAESPELRTHTFDEVYQAVEKLDSLSIPSPSSVKTLADLKFESHDVVEAPTIGRLHLTEWAQRRIGAMMGVRWSKFFGPMDPEVLEQAIRSHLTGRGSECPGIRLVSRELLDEEQDQFDTDGLLRGVVSPSYSVFRDLHALDRLHTVAGGLLEREWAFAGTSLLDNGSHFNLIHTEPFALIPGSSDLAYVGLRLRNSEVGAHSWTGSVCLLRITCVNGMMAPLVEGHRFRFIHKGMKLELVDEAIEEAFEQCYSATEYLPTVMTRLLEHKLEAPRDHLSAFMDRKGVSPLLRKAVIDAYEEEEVEGDNAYRALQAFTTLSPALRNDPNRQRNIEELASQYAQDFLDT